MHQIKLILICGSSGSGKSTLSSLIQQELSKNLKVEVLCQDSYYIDTDETNYNFDHPSAFDWELLYKDIDDILDNKKVEVPTYDYKNHKKYYNSHIINQPDVLILEGIYAIYSEKINELASLKIFVETPKDECLIRRICRDVLIHKKDLELTLNQWRNHVRPMYNEFIEPLKIKADIIIPWSNYNNAAIDILFKALSFK